jgi:uncharacterized membrane protein YdfJ with MMPL/SSD domain
MMKHAAPFVFSLVLTFAFLLLLLAFRSLVIASEAIGLNLLSVGAAYGALVVVFQWALARAWCTSGRTAGSRHGCRSSCS